LLVVVRRRCCSSSSSSFVVVVVVVRRRRRSSSLFVVVVVVCRRRVSLSFVVCIYTEVVNTKLFTGIGQDDFAAQIPTQLSRAGKQSSLTWLCG